MGQPDAASPAHDASGPAAPADPAAGLSAVLIAGRQGLDRRRSVVLGVVGLVTLAVIVVRVIPRIGSYSAAVTAMSTMTPVAVAVIVVAVVAYLAAYGLPFVAAVPGLGFWQGEQVNQAAFTIGNGLPAGGAVGLGVQYAMLAGDGVEQPAAAAAIVAVGLWSTFVTLAVPVLGVVAIAASGHASASYVLPAAVGLAVLFTAIVGFALVIGRQSVAAAVGNLGNRVAAPVLRRVSSASSLDLAAALLAFRAGMVDLVRRRWAAITAAQAGVTITQFAIVYAALRGVQGWSVAGTSVLVVFGAFAVAQLGLLIPLTPGGLGTVDATMIAMLVTMGVPAGQATAADLVWRAASFVPQVLLGAGALLAWSRSATREGAWRSRQPQARPN
jgi:uncharacterized protein (TIRG00374 family)